MLLEKERRQRTALEQEVSRLQTGLARQNAVILELERRDAERERDLAAMRRLHAGVIEQNTLLRQQVAALRQESARLTDTPLAPTPAPDPEGTPATPQREKTVRKKRAQEHNHGRHRLERATRWQTHAVETCPGCGTALSGGWIVRRVQVIELPAAAPVEVTEHRILRRQCPRCGKRVLPTPVGIEAGRIGQCRFGPRLMAAVVTMATVERLPGRMIQERLQREYGLHISHGGIVGIMQRVAHLGKPVYDHLQADVRASPVGHPLARVPGWNGWRENGQRTTTWTVSTAQAIYIHHGRRTTAEIDGILGADYPGTIVADCYAAYDHFLGPKQRCWAHLLRDLQKLVAEHGDDLETMAWVEGMQELYAQARDARGRTGAGQTPQDDRARIECARRCEALLRLLCPAEPDRRLPHATLAMRFRGHLEELFTFVRDPTVPATNNAAERSLRPLVIARKISGGTRSSTGSATRMTLYSICATARLQGKDPGAVWQRILLAPPGAASPLAVAHSVP
jgi:hypothetical protein